MAENELQEELKRLRADLAAVQSDVADLLGILKDMGSNKVGDMKNSLEDEIRRRREELRGRLDEAWSTGRKTMEDIEGGIGQHPLSSLVTAFGLGFIVAKLMDLGRGR